MIHIMINETNNSRAAEIAKRDRSLIYRRRKHLFVTLYTELREAITSYARETPV